MAALAREPVGRGAGLDDLAGEGEPVDDGGAESAATPASTAADLGSLAGGSVASE